MGGGARLEEIRGIFARRSRDVDRVGAGYKPGLWCPRALALVDDHIRRSLIVGLGGSRCPFGKDASSRNADFSLSDPIRLAKKRIVVGHWAVAVSAAEAASFATTVRPVGCTTATCADETASTHVANEHRFLRAFAPEEQRTIVALLRKLLLSSEENADTPEYA